MASTAAQIGSAITTAGSAIAAAFTPTSTTPTGAIASLTNLEAVGAATA